MKMNFLILVLMASSMVGCTRVGTGEMGIVLDANKNVKQEPVLNKWEFHFIDTLYVVDSTQIRVPIQNMTAKDVDEILFADIDAQVTYNILPKGAIAYYAETKELDRNPDGGELTLGMRYIEKEGRNALGKTFSIFKASTVNTDKTSMENEMKERLQKQVDERWPNAFKITDINIDSAQLDKNVEKVLQSRALIDSEKRTIQSLAELQKKQSELLDEEMADLKRIATKAGISVGDLMKYKNDKERNRVLSEMARNNSNTQVQIKE